MADLGQHQLGGVADVEFGERDPPQGFRELDRIALGAVAGCESGQSEREDVAARPAFPVHRTRGHDQRMRRVQAAGNTDHDLGIVQRAQPLLEPGNLDVVALVAIPFQAKRIARHEREPFHLALQADVPPTRWSSWKPTRRNDFSRS